MKICIDTATNLYLHSYLHDRHSRMVPHLRASARRYVPPTSKNKGGTAIRRRRRHNREQRRGRSEASSLTRSHSRLVSSGLSIKTHMSGQAISNLSCDHGPYMHHQVVCRRCRCDAEKKARRNGPWPGRWTSAPHCYMRVRVSPTRALMIRRASRQHPKPHLHLKTLHQWLPKTSKSPSSALAPSAYRSLPSMSRRTPTARSPFTTQDQTLKNT